jgi:hypothetical protein
MTWTMDAHPESRSPRRKAVTAAAANPKCKGVVMGVAPALRGW